MRIPSFSLRLQALIAPCAVLLLTAPCGADTLRLTDGSRIEGDVVDLGGNAVAVTTEAGRRTIARRDIAEATFEYHESRDATLETDLVLCRNGNDLRGTVSFSEDRNSVRVTFADGNRASIPVSQVLRIIRRGELEPGADTSLYFTREKESKIKNAIKALDSDGGEVERRKAEETLISFGLFAVPYVEEARKKAKEGSPSAASLDRVLFVERLKAAVSDTVELSEPQVYDVLGGTDPEQKERMIHGIFSRHPEEIVPIARAILMHPGEASSVRALVVGILGGLGRNDELIEIYDRAVGQVQLAVAVALGKNRILIGAPTLIEGLEMENRQIRRLCIESLEDFTGEDLGYHPDDTPLARRRAIKRWRDWWEKNADAIRLQANAVLSGQSIDTPQRVRARDLWARAGAAVQVERFAEAESLLRRAVRTDPTFFNAHVHLGILLYSRLGRVEEASKIFTDLVSRPIRSIDEKHLAWVHYHLARIAEIGGDEERAINELRRCLESESQFLPGHRALADLASRRATRTAGLPGTERRALLDLAIERYRSAIDIIEEREKEMVIIVRSDLPISDVPPFDIREHNRTVLDVRSNLRIQRAGAFFGIARAQSALGKREEALTALADGLLSIQDETTGEAGALHAEMRNYLAVLHEENGEFLSALREYRRVLREVDDKNGDALAGVRRLGGRVNR